MSHFLNSARPKPVSSVMLIFSLVSVSILAAASFTYSEGKYAFAQTEIQRTTELKVKFDVLVERGNDQNIRVKVNDVGSGDPVSGATVTITVYFPGGAPIRQFTLLSDTDGEASLKLPIDENAALGEYGIDLDVVALGYYDSFLPNQVFFAVMSDVDEDVSLEDYKDTTGTIS
ncbi:MAG TPA: hypothetical protein VIX38_01905 [Nitrososphaeraceae archaeon]